MNPSLQPSPPTPPAVSGLWLALVVGNSRLHWGAFEAEQWLDGWHTPHLSPTQARSLQASGFAAASWQSLGISPPLLENSQVYYPELWLASVVKAQANLWQGYTHLHPIHTAQVPLAGTYATLGVDRALTL
ncbi:MAG: hypothetical protein HC929_01565 [Leptolyngbyaceae cyanobacterium SM2_5_2]|nr:hypothetical protein [Leptolyngbyaceae cyanobacterium SM2_5_2]